MKVNFLKKSAFAVVMASALLGACKKEDPTPPTTPTCVLAEETDKNGGKEVYTVDANHRVTSTTEFNPSGKEISRTTYSYNVSGLLTKVATFEEGAETERLELTYSGDKVSRVNMYNDDNGSLELFANATFTFDGNGRNTGMMLFMGNSTTNAISEETYDYDSRGNITKTTGYNYVGAERTLGYTTEYTYDDKRSTMGAMKFPAFGMLGSMVNNVLTETQKDENGEVITTITNVYEYNSDNLPTKMTSSTSGGQMSDITTYSYSCH